MVNPYTFRRACLRRLLLLLLPGFAYTAQAQERYATSPTAVEPQCYCPCRPDSPLTGSIAGPSDLNKTDLFYLTKTDKLTGPVTWAASPAALFTSAGVTNSTTFLTAPSGCSTGTAVITATVRVESCRDSIVLRKEITVSGSGAVPVVRGTYYCTTCSDRSVKTLQLDGNTNNVTSFGTYRIDLTSNSSQDVFNAWDKFETAGASLRMVSGTNNRSGLIDLTPNANLAALAANVTNGCRAVRQMFRFSGGNATGYNVVSGPNPASSELRVGQPEAPAAAAAGKGTQAASTGVLYDGYGREVLRGQGPAGQVKLDVRALPAGVYILRTTTAGGLVRSERIQVVH